MDFVPSSVAFRIIKSFPPALRSTTDEYKTIKYTFEECEPKDNGKISFIADFNIERLIQLQNASPEEGRQLLQRWSY